MASSFADERGTIEDILTGPIDCVTKIFTHAGAIRGNHIHLETTQWTYVVSGLLRAVSPNASILCKPGALIEEPPGIPHAWRAEEDTWVLVLTRGPRSGEAYESDTIRLAPEDRLLK
jgi:quercetin dioxygenase-like cupin family protein